MKTKNTDKEFGALMEIIAKENIPSLETLETRNSDRLDFHDVHVSSIKKMLYVAFLTGVQYAVQCDIDKNSKKD